MGEMEDSGKTLALDSDATIADFSAIMADTFDRAYPMVKDTYRIRGYLTKMQNTLAAYVVETKEKELKKLDKKFKRFLKKAKSLPRRLMGRAQSEEDKAALKSASDGLAQLEKGIFGKAGLFASYQQSLAADRRADSLKAELETVAENFEAELATVVEKAQTLSAGAKQSSKDVVAMAVKSIAFIVAGGVALALVLGVLISRGLSKPLGEITVSMRSLADGDRSITVMHTDRKDEIGELAGALQVFKENAIEAERLRADAEKAAEAERQRAKDDQMRKEREAEQERQREAEKIEAERHQQKAQAERAQRIDDLNASFDDSASTVLESVTSSAAQMKTSAEAMTATAEQTNTQSVTVATAAEQASSKVQTVATAAEELSASINEIGRQVEESSKIASDAVQKAQKNRRTGPGAGERGPENRRGGGFDHRYRRTDQLVGAERDHRGGPRRRRRQGLRRRCLRGQEPGHPDGQCDGRDRQPDRRHPSGHPEGRRRHSGHWENHRRRQRNSHLHCVGGGGAVCGDPGDRPKRPTSRKGHR